MSSERSLRLRSLSAVRRSKRPPSHPPSPSPRRASLTTTHRKFPFVSEPIEILPKCSSEPLLLGSNGGRDDSPKLVSDGWLYRPITCTDLFSPSSPLHSPERLQSRHEAYQKDTKVVVTVTVEGSPGPIRTMVKLGSSVEETICLVIEKYGNEGRTPRLDKNASSIYELHLSYFSLESLGRSDSIGDVGSRSFYLRKGKSSQVLKSTADALTSETASADQMRRSPCDQPYPSMVFSPAYITRKFAKVMRRIRRLWKVLGCLHCS